MNSEKENQNIDKNDTINCPICKIKLLKKNLKRHTVGKYHIRMKNMIDEIKNQEKKD